MTLTLTLERAKMPSVTTEGMEWGVMPCYGIFSFELSFRSND